MPKMVANEQHHQRSRDEERRAEHQREDRNRQRRLVDRNQAEHCDTRGESDHRRPRRTDAVADEASREQTDQAREPHQREQIAGEQRIDAAILRKGYDVRRDEEVVEPQIA